MSAIFLNTPKRNIKIFLFSNNLPSIKLNLKKSQKTNISKSNCIIFYFGKFLNIYFKNEKSWSLPMKNTQFNFLARENSNRGKIELQNFPNHSPSINGN